MKTISITDFVREQTQISVTICPAAALNTAKFGDADLVELAGAATAGAAVDSGVFNSNALKQYNITGSLEYIWKRCWDSESKRTPEEILNDVTYSLSDILEDISMYCPVQDIDNFLKGPKHFLLLAL